MRWRGGGSHARTGGPRPGTHARTRSHARAGGDVHGRSRSRLRDPDVRPDGDPACGPDRGPDRGPAQGNRRGNPGPGNPGPGAAAAAVSIADFAFAPADLTVAAGTTVTWTNSDRRGHTVKSTDGAFASSGTLGNGDDVLAITFPAPGTFPYVCAIHVDDEGTITVTP